MNEVLALITLDVKLRKGELLNENFVSRYLLEPLIEAIELHKRGRAMLF